MANVWVCHNKGYDLSAAKAFGELRIIYDGMISNFFNTNGMAHEIKTKLKDYRKGDYLVLVGNVQANSFVLTIIMQNFGYANLLLFDGKTGEYTPRLIARHNMDMGENHG